MSVLGFFSGLMLAYAATKYQQNKNPLEDIISKKLPGANCGACGLAGCSAYATALVKDNIAIDLCTVGGQELTKELASILGKEAPLGKARQIAQIKCNRQENIDKKYNYQGIKTCKAINLLSDYYFSCSFSCLGQGDCIKSCAFDAIHLNENNMPIINPDKCTACGNCVAVCPKNLITLVSHLPKHFVFCNSQNKGAITRKNCSVGCIGCGICTKQCPFGAITIENNLAKVDEEKCTNCGICAQKCPTKSIMFIDDKPKLSNG